MENTEDQLVELCQHLGSSKEQAGIMARQLLKRSKQLAQERGISETEALAYLLRLVVAGVQGQAPDSGVNDDSP